MKEEIDALQKLIDMAVELSVNYGFQVIGALLVLILGAVVAGWISRALFRFFQKKELDITLSKFLSSVVKILVIAFAVIIALGKFGITIAPFIAALGAAAFGASFALQGPLSNYSAGLIIILTRPFVVGNTIQVAGVSGVVDEIKLSCTILSDEEGEIITIPNKSIIGEILQNSSENKLVQGVIGISYDSSPETAVSLISKVLEEHPEVDSSQEPIVGIKAFSDSSIDIGYRYWAPTRRYYHTAWTVNLMVFNMLKEAGIDIPFPQRDVRIVSTGINGKDA